MVVEHLDPGRRDLEGIESIGELVELFDCGEIGAVGVVGQSLTAEEDTLDVFESLDLIEDQWSLIVKNL